MRIQVIHDQGNGIRLRIVVIHNLITLITLVKKSSGSQTVETLSDMDKQAKYDKSEWFNTLHDSLWLRPDEGGENEADSLRRILHIRSGQRVLDAPCGAGRVAYHLARQGVEVVGIDLRSTFVKRAKRRFRRKGVQADLRSMDLRSIDFENEFHAIYNWFNSFGYFSDGENIDVVRRFSRALRLGGRLLIDQLNRERILRNFRPVGVRHGVLAQSKWDPREERLIGQCVVDGIAEYESRSSQRLYTLSQMRNLLSSLGLKVENVYGSLNREPYRRGSRQMIVVAHKVVHD